MTTRKIRITNYRFWQHALAGDDIDTYFKDYRYRLKFESVQQELMWKIKWA